MNTLNLIKKQIEKAAALHDAQISMTSYRGVKFECKQSDADEVHSTFVIAVTPTRSDCHGSTTNCWDRIPKLCCAYVITLR